MANYCYRVNCGSSQDQVPAGWSADQEYTDGADWGYTGGGGVLREADLPIICGAEPGLIEVMRAEHFNQSAYHFKLAAGVYTIRLIFAHTFEGDLHPSRSFSISANGQELVSAFEPFQEAGGCNKPAILELTGFNHQQDVLDLSFGAGALINGIEISESEAATQAVCISGPAKEITSDFVAPTKTVSSTKKILFVGNSGTFYWALPETTAALLDNSEIPLAIDVSSTTSGGKRFEWHATQGKCLELIKENKYDYVVMQDSSGGPVDFHESMQEYAGVLIKAVREAGSIPILYAYQGPERYTSEQRTLVMERYAAIAAEHKVALVPAASALDKAMQALPELNFHNPDRHHLGMFGGYTLACCFYQIFSGQSAEGHAYPAVLGDRVKIPTDIARILEGCAAAACAEYKHVGVIA